MKYNNFAIFKIKESRIEINWVNSEKKEYNETIMSLFQENNYLKSKQFQLCLDPFEIKQKDYMGFQNKPNFEFLFGSLGNLKGQDAYCIAISNEKKLIKKYSIFF